jgi:hypothetical protein
LRAAYDPKKIKRLQTGHSSSESEISYGADYRNPHQLDKTAKQDLDNGAKKTPVGSG